MRKIIAISAAILAFGSAIVTAAPVEAREWRKQGMSGHHYNGGNHYSNNRGRHYNKGRYYGGNNGRYYGGNRYGYRYDRGYNNGAVAAGIIGGIAAGAIIGSAARNSSDGSSYCAQRFRSYDPRSGTYLSTDGNRYACP